MATRFARRLIRRPMVPVVATVNSIRLVRNRESGDASTHGTHAQTHLVGGHRALQVKSFARGGDPDAAPPAQCAAKKIAKVAGL